MRITRFVEKPPPGTVPSNLVSTGVLLLEPEVLDYVENEKWDFAKDLFPYLMRLWPASLRLHVRLILGRCWGIERVFERSKLGPSKSHNRPAQRCKVDRKPK